MKKEIRVIIADDHTMFRQGVVALLKDTEDINIVGSVSSGNEVLEMLPHQEVDLVITDLTMENLDGLSLTKALNEQYPTINILVLTMHSDPDHIKELLEAGASGYLLKNADSQEFLNAVYSVYQKGQYFSEKVKNLLVTSMMKREKKPTNTAVRLTRRESEILSLIAQEFTNAEVSEKLFISLHTVETHRRNIMKKLNVHNGVGLLRQAIQLGLSKE